MIIVKAFNQEFKIDIKVEMSQFNVKVLTLIKSKRIDLLKKLNDFIALAEYEKVKSAAYAEYEKVKSAVSAEYEKVRSSADAEYEKVRSSAVAEYEKVRSSVDAEYKKVKSAAVAEYQQKINKKLDELLSRI